MKPKPVIMPAKPPYQILRAMANHPLILAASDKEYFDFVYRACRNALKARKSGK